MRIQLSINSNVDDENDNDDDDDKITGNVYFWKCQPKNCLFSCQIELRASADSSTFVKRKLWPNMILEF